MKQTEQSLVERLRSLADWLEEGDWSPSHIETAKTAAAQLERQLAAPAELPPLPEPIALGMNKPETRFIYGYTADQMREYARAAQRAAPTAQGSGKDAPEEMCPHCDDPLPQGQEACDECEKYFAAPQEAPQPRNGWVAYITFAEGRFLAPSRPVKEGTYALVEREVWEAPQQEPVAWMWQHDETGRIGFVDVWQVECGKWETGNPRLKLIAPLYRHPAPISTISAKETE